MKKNEHIIYLAGGCFWGVENFFKKLKGVLDTEVGYANGINGKTSYISLRETDHAETLKLTFDENVISLAEVLEKFFLIIDPTSLNKQGGDIGRQYRTGIYYIQESDLNIINEVFSKEQKKYSKPLVVEVECLKNFVLAEEYHQDYLEKNPGGYCHIKIEP